ncbi:MAG: hypothetical protein ACFFD2_25485 [Promethearchaeota archaeon]
MTELKNFIPKSIIESIKSTKEEVILLETKKRYLNQIEGRWGGKIYLKLCCKYEKLSDDNFIDNLANNLSLSKIYYITANFFTCLHSHYILTCTKFDLKYMIEKFEQLKSDFGQPIWEKKISSLPILWNVFSEYDKNHFYITYLHSNPKITSFDPIVHEFGSFQPTGVINVRIHLDHSLMLEIYNKDSSVANIEKSISDISKKLKINDLNFFEITQANIENFDRSVKEVSHEAREGEETTLYLTRVNNTKDTRNDIIRVEYGLDDREFRKEHGIIEVNGNDFNIGIIKGRKGRIRIMRYLPPQEQIAVMHEVFRILGWID